MRNDSGPETERTRNLGQERRATRESEEVAVGPLLARANLLRMRRQWDEAIAVCTEALRRAPESPTAHSLMGDIYEAQGKMDDAAQWFSMAVDLAPANAADRQKLERAVAAKRAVLASEPRLSGVVPGGSPQRTASAGSSRPGTDRTAVLPHAEVARRTAELTIDWFDRVFPPGRAEGIARMILALCAVLAVLLVGAAGFLYLSFSRDVEVTEAASRRERPEVTAAPAVAVMEVGAQTTPSAPGLGVDTAAAGGGGTV
ncbi:MAG TPA: tetratricopeptide repeat protein, partial [Armatimonadaceae bacterium]|nr:tetratricopeptide repeat protein [Armatimonadaceae bacterium]